MEKNKIKRTLTRGECGVQRTVSSIEEITEYLLVDKDGLLKEGKDK